MDAGTLLGGESGSAKNGPKRTGRDLADHAEVVKKGREGRFSCLVAKPAQGWEGRRGLECKRRDATGCIRNSAGKLRATLCAGRNGVNGKWVQVRSTVRTRCFGSG